MSTDDSEPFSFAMQPALLHGLLTWSYRIGAGSHLKVKAGSSHCSVLSFGILMGGVKLRTIEGGLAPYFSTFFTSTGASLVRP